VDRLDRALDMLVSHEAQFCEAVAADFGTGTAGAEAAHSTLT
jgi:hypothetical protein